MCYLSQRGAGLYVEKSLLLTPDWLVLMEMGTMNPSILLVQKALSLLVRMKLLLLVGEDADGDIDVHLRWLGKASILLVEI